MSYFTTDDFDIPNIDFPDIAFEVLFHQSLDALVRILHQNWWGISCRVTISIITSKPSCNTEIVTSAKRQQSNSEPIEINRSRDELLDNPYYGTISTPCDHVEVNSVTLD